MSRILGIDPGSRVTGYGIIETQGQRTQWVNSGCIRIQGDSLAERLKIICEGVQELLETYQPDEVAIEQVFMHRNADSALKLGQARGAAIGVVATRSIPVSEYSAKQIKKAVVGKGGAAKDQVQHMVKALLCLSKTPQADAADALAVALCHAHTCLTLGKIGSATSGRLAVLPQGMRRRRWR